MSYFRKLKSNLKSTHFADILYCRNSKLWPEGQKGQLITSKQTAIYLASWKENLQEVGRRKHKVVHTEQCLRLQMISFCSFRVPVVTASKVMYCGSRDGSAARAHARNPKDQCI